MLKRILYISPGTDLGGGEVSLLTLIANLDRTRYVPVICVYGNGRFVERAQKLDCPLHLLTYSSVLSQLGFVVKIANLIRTENIDLVHVNTLDIRAGIATRLMRRPLLGHLRVIFPTTWVDRTFVKIADKTISVSNAVRDHFCNAEATPPDAFETIYNAVDTQYTSETEDLRSELKLAQDTPLIGVVGRVDPWKGMETFVEAAAKLKTSHTNVHFVIAGNPGPAQEEQAYDQHLRHRVAELGLAETFHFLGYRADALNVINQLNILVVPSRILQTPTGIKTEGFGRVAAEGLAMSTPVIASRVGGLPEIIEHEKSGLLFAESDSEDLTHNIKRLLDNPEFGQQLSNTGNKRFQEHFSVARHLQNVQSLYDKLLH